MEPTPDLAARAEVSAPAELIVQTGRLKGTTKPLFPPLVLIGRAEGSDIRLNVEGVRPLHCVLVHSPKGLILRDLQGGKGTLVNDKPTATCLLQNGDQLTIGPFQFQVRVTASFVARIVEPVTRNSPEREALRIQAAAVAAQQAALAEQEGRLQQRRATLEQQEEQLAAHLEEKRRRLVELRDQTREAYGKLKKERSAHESNLDEGHTELEAKRREVEDQREQALGERRHLKALNRRLKRRWHRYWSAERNRVRQIEGDLAHQREGLEKERQALAQARLAFNAEMEIGRRELRDAWDQLHRHQQQEEDRLAQEGADLAEHAAALDDREAALAEVERQLAEEQQQAQEVRQKLEKEVEGLDNRVRNYRRKIIDHEQEIAQLESRLSTLHAQTGSEPVPASEASTAEPAPVQTPAVVPAPTPSSVPEFEPVIAETRLASLERLAGELADQRLQLIEQCQRLNHARARWQHYRKATAAELEAVGRQILEREQALAGREQALEPTEILLRQRQGEALHLQRYLEGWQARMAARETSWEAERDRLLADLQAREKVAAARLEAVDQLHQRWVKRRQREVDWLKAERAACEKLRRECVTLRDDWHRRAVALEQEQRRLAEQALAMEQYQQETLAQADNASAAGKRLEKLRKRWAGQSAAAEKAVAQQREELRAEATRMERFHERIQNHAAKVAAREADLSHRQSEWEHTRLQSEDELTRLRTELVSLRSQSSRYERQVGELRDEVERMARLFLDESETVRLPAAQAA